MTSVTFPFFVGPPNEDKTLSFKDAEFRFTTKYTRQLERAAGSGLGWIIGRGQSVDALVLLVCYGLKWKPVEYRGKKVEISEDIATDLIDEFIDAGGDVTSLSAACSKALKESGVYGKPEEKVEGDRPLG